MSQKVDYCVVADAVGKQIPSVQFRPPPQEEVFVVRYTIGGMTIPNMDHKDDLQTVANSIAKVIGEQQQRSAKRGAESQFKWSLDCQVDKNDPKRLVFTLVQFY